MSAQAIASLNRGRLAGRSVKVSFVGARSKIADQFFNWLSSPSPNIVAVVLDPSEPGPRPAVLDAQLSRYAFPPVLP